MKRAARLVADKARVEMAMAMAAGALDRTHDDMIGNGRGVKAVFARQVAMYIVAVGFGMSCALEAAAMGRDRSTVAYACRAVEEWRDDPAFDRWIEALEQSAAIAPVMT